MLAASMCVIRAFRSMFAKERGLASIRGSRLSTDSAAVGVIDDNLPAGPGFPEHGGWMSGFSPGRVRARPALPLTDDHNGCRTSQIRLIQ